MIVDGPAPGASQAAASAGRSDEGALAERFWERVRVFARRRLATESEAEDVAQETIRRVLEALRGGRLRSQDALPAFVFETARNICLHRHRSDAREGRAFDRARPWMTYAESPDPLANLQSERDRETVRTALGRLADDDRNLLRMSFYEALDTAEVAERLGVSVGAVRVRRFRALHRLRAILEGGAPSVRET